MRVGLEEAGFEGFMREEALTSLWTKVHVFSDIPHQKHTSQLGPVLYSICVMLAHCLNIHNSYMPRTSARATGTFLIPQYVVPIFQLLHPPSI